MVIYIYFFKIIYRRVEQIKNWIELSLNNILIEV